MSHFILACHLTRLSGYNMSRMRRVAISDPRMSYPIDETIAGRCLHEGNDCDDTMKVTNHLFPLSIYTCDFMKYCTWNTLFTKQ